MWNHFGMGKWAPTLHCPTPKCGATVAHSNIFDRKAIILYTKNMNWKMEYSYVFSTTMGDRTRLSPIQETKRELGSPFSHLWHASSTIWLLWSNTWLLLDAHRWGLLPLSPFLLWKLSNPICHLQKAWNLRIVDI